MTDWAELLGESPGIAAVRTTIERLLERRADARRLPPVLILGETGTGKGLIARLIHGAGPRAGGPFVDVNCAAIPETLLEAELFGFERGAFTDARHAKPGLFQTAHRGTMFLDEVGLLPDGLQAKLLKVIEDHAVRRLGSTRSEPIDVWVLTATSEDLVAAMRARRFREELYHRLAVLTLRLPPLRERGEDVLLLAEHFLVRVCNDYGLAQKAFAPDARVALMAYRWPGNIRELSNVIERVALLTEGPTVTAAMLGLPGDPGADSSVTPERRPAASLDEAVASVERAHLLDALRETNWNISRAATRLGLARSTLRYRIETYGLHPEGAAPQPRARPARSSPASPKAPPVPSVEVPVPVAVRWERRRVTLLRAVLVSAREEAASFETSRPLEVLIEKARSFGGSIGELSPTGIVAAFGLEPMEDAPRWAAHAALAIRKVAERARAADPERPTVRLAMHTQQLMVGRVGENLELDAGAKRAALAVLDALIARAERGSILVSSTAAAFLERRFDLVPAGVATPEVGAALRLVGLERSGLEPGRRMARFVGRRHELELLHSRLAAAMGGLGQIVGVVGEAGIGKSRLLLEFRQSVVGERVAYLEGRCASYGSNIPYLPVLDPIRMGCRILESDSPAAIVEKVRFGLELIGMDPDETAPFFLHLLGLKEGTERLAALSPEAIQVRTFEILRETSLKSSRRRPLILAVEDMHWIDSASEAYLTTLAEGLVGAPILLVATYRPGYRPRWLERSYATQIALHPLGAEDSRDVVHSVLEPHPVPESLAQLLVVKGEGNPFFLEELARAVGGSEDPQMPVAVPDTIQEVLLARIDRLPEVPRHLAQTAAVLGRVVSTRLLAAIWDGPGPLDAHLRELARLEFLDEQGGGTETVFVFRHALTQEVAYESLPEPRRRALHAATGAALEAVYAGRLEEVYDRLAYHYARTDVAPKAVEYLTRFADRSARSYAHAEAVTALQEALAHVEGLPPAIRDRRRLRLALRQARSLSFLGRFRDGLDLLLREGAPPGPLTDPELAGPYHFWLGHTYSYLGEQARAVEHAGRALAEAERAGDEATMGRAHLLLAQESSWSGQPSRGVEQGRRAVELLARAGEPWWLGLAHWIVGINHVIVGDFELALEAEADALATGETIGDPRIQSYATWSTGWIHALMGDWEAGIEACQRGLGRSLDPVNTAVVLGHLGYAHLEKGDLAEAIALLERSVREVTQFGFRRLQGRFATFLGEAYLASGRLEKARELVGEGLRLSREAEYWYAVGWAQLALGRIGTAEGRLAEAGAHLGDALETFEAIGARFLAARAHLALAELGRGREDPDAAARHLGEAYGLFRILRVPRYEERARQLAADLGVGLDAV